MPLNFSGIFPNGRMGRSLVFGIDYFIIGQLLAKNCSLRTFFLLENGSSSNCRPVKDRDLLNTDYIRCLFDEGKMYNLSVNDLISW